jgi:predicted PurR-regulated permease PerM
MERYEWGNALIRETRRTGFAGQGQFFSRATGVLSGTAGWLVSTVIIIFIGVYTASNPSLYHRGVVQLFPNARRERISEILAMMGHQLRWWLIGRLAGMVIVGVVTAFTLNMMGIPMAGLLGLISGLLTFIPNLGPIISAVPVVLIALMESPSKALIVAVFYTVLQMVEGYVLTPLILQRTVSLPPALLLSAQAILGSLLGLAGIAMAAPITVLGMVLVNMLWLDRIGKGEPAVIV